MTSITFDYNTSVLRSLFSLVSDAFTGVYHAAKNYYVKSQAERELYAMDNSMLEDLGINRGEIHARVWGK